MSKTKSRRADDMKDDYVKAYKVRPSDEDRGGWAADPGIDWKAGRERWKSPEDDDVKAYKARPGDEEGGGWEADHGIDGKAEAFIASRRERWKSPEVAN
ncbi:uncharacterized protein [Coffea arabica]|uniref:Uncharacterized protein isoform X2 n=1 Tax=Coffea arabica TaxID=13443 RepID=A0ABM4X0R4_COFAR